MIETVFETRSSVLPCDHLAESQRDEMFALLANHFNGVSRSQFDRDLTEKNAVILLHQGCRLVGFSTLLVYETSFASKPLSVVYSGDTIVAPEAWGSTRLFRAWIRSVKEMRSRFPKGDFYWLLLTSGFRTYRLLPLFWREFVPRFDSDISKEKKQLLDHLAQERFGDQYDPIRGIVQFAKPQRLRAGLNQVPPERCINPHIAYFLSRNPLHTQGDELVCLTELSNENLTAAGRRMIR